MSISIFVIDFKASSPVPFLYLIVPTSLPVENFGAGFTYNAPVPVTVVAPVSAVSLS